MTGKPTNKQLIRTALEKEGNSLTLEQLISLTGIPKQKIQQTLTPYENKIVRIGPKTYDLAERVYPGKTFRWTPSEFEFSKKVLCAEEDAHLFLAAAGNYWAVITLVDKEGGNIYQIKRIKRSGRMPVSYYLGLTAWFKKTGFELGDDILLTCQSLADLRFLVRKERKQDRNEQLIAERNRELADLVYDIILHSWTHSEQDLFLFRKYVYVYPFNREVAPDSLRHALDNDSRFLISGRDEVLGISGNSLNDYLQVSLRKYYFQNNNREWVPVFLSSDEYGRYGYCAHCEERLIWEQESGWRHLKDELEIVDAYLPKEFFSKK